MTALVELTLKTSLILALGMLAAFALRRRSAAVRHWILASTLFCAAAAPLIGLLTPQWSMPAASAPASGSGPVVDVSFSPVTAPGAPASTGPVPARASSSAVGDLIRSVAVPAWWLGIATNLSLLLIGMFRLTRLRSAHARVDSTITESLERTSAQFGLRRRVTMVRSTRPAVIVTWGVLKPKIVLPADVGEWPRERLHVVLAHEVAHITRGDRLLLNPAEGRQVMYWLQPVL